MRMRDTKRNGSPKAAVRCQDERGLRATAQSGQSRQTKAEERQSAGDRDDAGDAEIRTLAQKIDVIDCISVVGDDEVEYDRPPVRQRAAGEIDKVARIDDLVYDGIHIGGKWPGAGKTLAERQAIAVCAGRTQYFLQLVIEEVPGLACVVGHDLTQRES